MKLLISFLFACIFTFGITAFIYGFYKLTELLQRHYDDKIVIIILFILMCLTLTISFYFEL